MPNYFELVFADEAEKGEVMFILVNLHCSAITRIKYTFSMKSRVKSRVSIKVFGSLLHPYISQKYYILSNALSSETESCRYQTTERSFCLGNQWMGFC